VHLKAALVSKHGTAAFEAAKSSVQQLLRDVHVRADSPPAVVVEPPAASPPRARVPPPARASTAELLERWHDTAHRTFPAPPPFRLLLERADGVLREEEADQIERDLHRSGRAELGADDTLELHCARLRSVLRAWCVLRPDIGYCQGLNFVAAAMLCACEQEVAPAFSLFVLLLSRLPRDFCAPRRRSNHRPARRACDGRSALLCAQTRRAPRRCAGCRWRWACCSGWSRSARPTGSSAAGRRRAQQQE
jgi:hypothetical protein